MLALNYVLVALGGAFGALARYQVNLWAKNISVNLPYSTLLVNVAGSFFFGFMIFVLVEKTQFNEQLRLLLLVGFAGAFTTFSTFSYEMVSLMQLGEWLNAFIFILANLCLSLGAFAVAFYLSKAVFQ